MAFDLKFWCSEDSFLLPKSGAYFFTKNIL